MVRRILLFALLATATAADGPKEPDPEAIRAGLLAPGRGARETAEQAARRWARTDPAGVEALFSRIDLRGRTILVRALASAGTRHAAMLALKHVADPAPEIFQALLVGLPDGGEKALFEALPENTPPARREAIEAVRLQWKVEQELVRLKSPTGPTGHYEGQYKRVRELGPNVIPVFFDIVVDRARPIPGEGAAGPYRPIHPGMVRFERQELRNLAAYAFGEIVGKDDSATIDLLMRLFLRYWGLDAKTHRFEKENLAPAVAFSLHDLGRARPARAYIAHLNRVARGWDRDALSALWELGYANIRIGNYEQGERAYKDALEATYSKAIAAYNLACNFAMRAKREPRRRKEFIGIALKYLELSVHRHNYGDWKWMEEDGDLDFIRDQPRYQAVLRKLQKRYPERKKGRVAKKKEEFLK